MAPAFSGSMLYGNEGLMSASEGRDPRDCAISRGLIYLQDKHDLNLGLDWGGWGGVIGGLDGLGFDN